MKEEITLENTFVSFTPSFLGNGWETSLLPKMERGYLNASEYKITFSWLTKILQKMQKSGQEKGVISWTNVIARLFL